MRPPIEQPTVTKHGNETILRHPAFGSIHVCRTSGGTELYGSDFTHRHYVSIEIHESVEQRLVKAKIEIVAWMDNAIRRRGMQSIAERAGAPLQLGGPNDHQDQAAPTD